MKYQRLVKTKLTYDDRIARFSLLGPFKFLDTIRCHGGDEKPRCSACGSRLAYHFIVVADRLGEKHNIAPQCVNRLKVIYRPIEDGLGLEEAWLRENPWAKAKESDYGR